MRVLVTFLAVVLAACSTAQPTVEPTPLPSREPGATAVVALLDLSGPRAAIGTAQRNAMQLWLDQSQSRKTHVKFVDTASVDARLVIELRRAAVEDHADAVVIGTPIQLDDTFVRAIEVAALPVLLTLPVAEPAAGDRWVFALAPTFADLARIEIDDAMARDVIAPTLLVSDDSPTSIAERIAIGRELERRGMIRPTVVSVTAQDALQRIRPGASVARSVLLTGAASSYIDAARALAASGVTPRTYLSYVSESSELSALRDAQSMVTWPGSRNIVTSSVPLSSLRYLQQYVERHGAPSTIGASAYDALSLIDAAAAASGADRERIRERIESAVFAGVATTYSFAPGRHAGFRASDLAYLRWITVGRPAIALAPDPPPKEEK